MAAMASGHRGLRVLLGNDNDLDELARQMNRFDEIQMRAKAQRAKLPAPFRNETTHSTELQARRAAERCNLPNTKVDAVQTTHGWVGVVKLRQDQRWLRDIVREHGCRFEMIPL
jgi:hypothetical protein